MVGEKATERVNFKIRPSDKVKMKEVSDYFGYNMTEMFLLILDEKYWHVAQLIEMEDIDSEEGI